MNNQDLKLDITNNADLRELKMITFSLAGKDYGIDIMQVKEISRMLDFTYIPNAPYYVRGAYNLRGEIISVIDLRLLFHLPVPEKEDSGEEDFENLIVLQFGDYYLGVVVDRVDKVCTVQMSDVQGSHPYFSDINIKYIKGLAHLDNRLYILLNVNMLADGDVVDEELLEEGFSQSRMVASLPKNEGHAVDASEKPDLSVENEPTEEEEKVSEEEIKKAFGTFCDKLFTACGFCVNDWNYQSLYHIFTQYFKDNKEFPKCENSGDFSRLIPFLGDEDGYLWPNEYFDAFSQLNFDTTSSFNVWSSWSGYGYEAYSVGAAILNRFPSSRLRIWATDDDLLKVSMGPNLTVQNIDPSSPLIDFVDETKSGYKFKKFLAEKLLFEYHSIENGNGFPKMKFIIAKGKVSFYNKDVARKIIFELYSKLDVGSYILVAQYENLPESEFRLVYSGSLKIYQRL